MVERIEGEPLRVIANYFRLSRSPVNNVTLYSISFVPDIEADNRSLRTCLIINGKNSIESILGQFIRTGNVLYSKVCVQDPISIPVKDREENEYILILSMAGSVDSNNIQTYRMYANSALKKMLNELGLKQVTRLPRYYDTTQIQHVEQHRLDVWRGYTASFSHHMKEMLLNIDFSSKIIRHATALDMMLEIRESHKTNLEEALNSIMVGMIVMAKYGNFKCYRIEQVIVDETPNSTFDSNEGPITYLEYYYKKYRISITMPRQPLIVTHIEGGRKEIKLIPELCCLTGITDEMRHDFRLMMDIAKYTRLQPIERLSVSTSLADQISSHPKCREISDAYNLEINPNPVVVNGIRLPLEQIKCGKTESDIIEVDRKGSFFLKTSLHRKAKISHLLFLFSPQDVDYRERFIKAIIGKGKMIDLEIAKTSTTTYTPQNIKDIISRLNNPPPGYDIPTLALVVVNSGDKRIYNDVKQACAMISGIPTQCIKSSNIRGDTNKKYDSILSKVILQIAVKTGSAPWVFNPPGVEGLPPRTMVVGIDVFHDTVSRSKSVLGFLASLYPDFSQYFNTVRIHERSGQEIGGMVGDCLKEALKNFFEITRKKFFPDLIVVFRDGVSDSQIEAARTFEVQAMKSIIESIPNCESKLVYMILNKKTNTKLFVDGYSSRGIENPPFGTVVNSVIIPDDSSFYLISHTVTQGIASPTLYRCISNDPGIDLMIIAKFAFKLCYMYYNWTGGIKVPAPTMMAHKLAHLVGQSVHDVYKEELRQLSWFY